MTVPYWASADGDVQLHLGDCLDVLRALPADSVDAIVTDPPAGIAFMGRDWDDFKRARHRFVDMLAERLGEALRVLKPGGHALVWSIPRTSHWTAWAVEDAGFEVRDCVLHLFGSGFPKSLDVGRAIDKAAGAEREVRNGQGEKNGTIDFGMKNRCPDCGRPYFSGSPCTCPRTDRIAVTEDAARWDGWGTALKPGQEMWWLARKPLQAGSVAGNVLEWGTGALNIAACRVAHVNGENPSAARRASRAPEREAGSWANDRRSPETYAAEHPGEADGRWPANVVLTHSAGCGERCAADCPVGELDRQSGVREGGNFPERRTANAIYGGGNGTSLEQAGGARAMGDTGGASRFYPVFRYQAKAPASERPRLDDGTAHETVKPLGFISWAVRLITPPGGTVLDLFGGSGPVAEACIIEGFRAVIIERERKSADLIVKRLSKPIQPVMFGLDAS